MNPRFLSAIKELGGDQDALESVISRLSVGVFVDQPEKGCIYANAEVLRMFGMTWDQFAGFGWAGVVVPEDMDTLREAIARYEQEKDWIEVQYRIDALDGVQRTLHVLGKAVLDEAGKQLGSVMIGRDITSERATRDRALQSQKLEVIGRLAGRVAHDINNILTPIVGSASLLEQESLRPQARVMVETIQQSADHAEAITRQLLGLSRHQDKDERAARVDHEIGRMMRLLRQVVGEGVELRATLNAPDAQVGLAAHELAQILLNLTINGRDAVEGNGRIEIDTRLTEGQLELRVNDSGSGMSRETCSRMFEPFFTTKGEGKGTGLGLYTVDDLVSRAGGKISVESRPGHGTKFLISLPVIAATARSFLHPDESELPPCRVLLVDDNDALRQTVAYALALRRHQVKTSAGVARAIDLLRNEPFDLVITDVMLADGKGSELVSAARSIRPELRFLYISGFDDEVSPAADTSDAEVHFLAKPFHPNQLIQAMSRAMMGSASP